MSMGPLNPPMSQGMKFQIPQQTELWDYRLAARYDSEFLWHLSVRL